MFVKVIQGLCDILVHLPIEKLWNLAASELHCAATGIQTGSAIVIFHVQ